ncbi:MAG TPA: sulfotransferase [Mycobacteriales bacterium]|nr:sulfotransferase [Mycobacteriales bacterium]
MRNSLLFLGGLHRSGTTMLADLLTAHPQISGFVGTGAPMNEGQYLQTVCPTDEQHGGPGRFAWAPEAHLTEESPLATAAAAETLRSQWERYWDLSRPVLMDKSPPNLLRFRLLQALFPGARFILVLRHPVPVSLSTQKWSASLTVPQLLAHWVHAYDLATADTAYLRHVITLRYEDLIADPESTLERVREFLDLDVPFDSSGIDPTVNDSYFSRWRAVAPDIHSPLAEAIARHGYRIDSPELLPAGRI